MECLESSDPVGGLQARGSAFAHHPRTVARHSGAVIAPQAVVEEEHAVVSDAGLLSNDGEVRPRFILGERRSTAYLHVTLE